MLRQNLWVQIPSFALHGIGCDHMAQKRMCWCLHNQNTRGPKPHQKGGSVSPVEPRAQLKGCEPYFQIHKWLLPRPLPICATTLPFISKKQRGNVLSSRQGHCKAMTCETSRELLVLCHRDTTGIPELTFASNTQQHAKNS